MDGEEEQEKEMKIAVNKVKTKKVGLAFSFKPNCVSRKKEKRIRQVGWKVSKVFLGCMLL